MSSGRGADPAQVVAQPVERVLGVLILVGLASFVLSVLAVLLAHEPAAGAVHEAAHFALLVVMAVVVVARGLQLVHTGGRPDRDTWTRVRELDRTDAMMAQLLTHVVPLAWLFGSVSIVLHHAPSLAPAAPFVGALLPMAAALWILATFAWHDLCRERLERALEESNRRYREYWRNLPAAR